jgi:hypothetical protein
MPRLASRQPAVLIAAVILAACSYQSSDTRFAVPSMIAPSVDRTAATIHVQGHPEELILGIEGFKSFVRATAPSGQVVLEQMYDWPTTEQKLSPGHYQLTLYQRNCDGNCDFLDPPALSCILDMSLEEGDARTISVTITGFDKVACEVVS